MYFLFFFFNDTATTEIYTLSLHDALPISGRRHCWRTLLVVRRAAARRWLSWRRRSNTSSRSSWSRTRARTWRRTDRKSTRLNSSHSQISYAVFCLKKKKKKKTTKKQDKQK